MKVLLVDDEQHVQEAIHLSLDWPSYGVTEVLYADNGKEALDILLKDKVSVMFCDMHMPVMDGVKLLEEVKKREMDVQVIAISGYDDFQYTRAAILAKGVDYILKPFTKKSLDDAMQLAISRIQGNFKMLKKEKDALKANVMLSTQTIGRWINGERYDAQFLASAQQKLGITGKQLQLIVLLPINSKKVLEELFEDDEELFYFALRNVAYEILQDCSKVEFLPVEKNLWIILCQPGNGNQITPLKEEQLVDSFLYALQLRCYCISSSPISEIDHLPEMMKLLKKELLMIPVVSDSIIPNKPEPPHFLEREMLIQTALQNNNFTALQKAIENFCSDIRQNGPISLGQLQICTAEANLVYKRIYELIPEKLTPMEYISSWVCNLTEWEAAVYELLASLAQGMEDNMVNPQIIQHYLLENYGKSITLTDIAKHFHMSSQHISRIYKSTYQTTIMSALTKMRIDMAKRLLMTTDITIKSIAQNWVMKTKTTLARFLKSR